MYLAHKDLMRTVEQMKGIIIKRGKKNPRKPMVEKILHSKWIIVGGLVLEWRRLVLEANKIRWIGLVSN